MSETKDLLAKVIRKTNKEGKVYHQICVFFPNDPEPLSDSIYVNADVLRLVNLLGVTIYEDEK